MGKLEVGQRCPSAASEPTARIDLRDRPQLSIVVPVFNGASTLEACLRALLSAPGPLREIIMVDDASQDNSVKIAEELGICPIVFHANRGCTDARNEGVKHARAPILVFVDCDVVIHSDALERVGKFFSENQDHTAIFGSYDATPAAPQFVVDTAISSIISPIRTRRPRPKPFGRGWAPSGDPPSIRLADFDASMAQSRMWHSDWNWSTADLESPWTPDCWAPISSAGRSIQ